MKRTAGLPLSVGHASRGTRILIAVVIAVTSALCIGGGVMIARVAIAARAMAVILIVPLGLIAAIGVAFVLAPWSRFGIWLDHFVPRLGEPRVAIGTAIVFWLVAFLITW